MVVPGDAVTLAWHDGAVDAAAVFLAAERMRDGGVVGMPTETVYGLAARARQQAEVARVFAIKGRPADHPVIVHVADASALQEWGMQVPAYATSLAQALWPGPLTLVVPAADDVPRFLTGGQDTVGLRCPAHPVALALIDAVGPVAAPSANQFGQVSPTRASDVLADIGDLLGPQDVVLDGGDCPVGVESTILDCTGEAPRVLRWGAVELSDLGMAIDTGPSAVRAPGGLASHYALAPPYTCAARRLRVRDCWRFRMFRRRTECTAWPPRTTRESTPQCCTGHCETPMQRGCRTSGRCCPNRSTP